MAARKFTILVVLFLIVSLPFIAKATPKEESSKIEFSEIKGEHAPGEILVKFKRGVKEDKIKKN